MANNNGVDYKAKYQDLRARYIQSLDMAFRTGYEQGSNMAQMQQQAQQMQMQQQQEQQAQQQGGNQPGQEDLQQAAQQQVQGGVQDQQAQDQQLQSELDAHIAELEGLVHKSEPSVSDIKKAIHKFKDKLILDRLAKSMPDVRPRREFKPSNSYTHNLPEDSKKTLSMQEKIVSDILTKWEDEGKQASEDMMRVIGTEALAKKE